MRPRVTGLCWLRACSVTRGGSSCSRVLQGAEAGGGRRLLCCWCCDVQVGLLLVFEELSWPGYLDKALLDLWGQQYNSQGRLQQLLL